MPVTNGIIKSSFCVASIWLHEHLFTGGWCLRCASGPIDQSGGAVTFTCHWVIFSELGVWGFHLPSGLPLVTMATTTCLTSHNQVLS